MQNTKKSSALLVRLPVALKREIDEIARTNRRTQVETCRIALEQFVDSQRADQVEVEVNS